MIEGMLDFEPRKAVFPLARDRIQVIEFDPGSPNVPPTFRAFTFARDANDELHLEGEPVLIVGAAAAFVGRAWDPS